MFLFLARTIAILYLTAAGHMMLDASGATRTAITSGNWATPATWNGGILPAPGDVMIIPGGMTVTVTTNESYSGAAMRVRVYGTLFFNGGGAKLSFPCGSIVEIMTPTATIAGNSSANSQTIRICNSTVWSVGADNNATGYEAYPPNSTLPVTLLYFRAVAEHGTVLCEWATASEQESAYFTVEASRDGIAFDPIGEAPAAGNSQGPVHYSLVDEAPSPGISYYRLKQVDEDGSAVHSAVVAVQCCDDHGGGLLLYPNPSTGALHTVVGGDPSLTVVITNGNGREVMRWAGLGARAGFDASALPGGLYTVTVTDADGRSHAARWVKVDR